jgi:CMP-2-keto-3-deoxyoctulosonic acid synthetase
MARRSKVTALPVTVVTNGIKVATDGVEVGTDDVKVVANGVKVVADKAQAALEFRGRPAIRRFCIAKILISEHEGAEYGALY